MRKLHTVLDWFGRWWKSFITVAATMAAFFGAFWGNFADPGGRTVFFLVGILGAVIAGTLPIVETRQQYKTIAALQANLALAETNTEAEVRVAKVAGRQDFLLVMDFALKPLLRKLGPMLRSNRAQQKKELASELKMLALSVLKEVVGSSVPMTRANYFKIQAPNVGGEIFLIEAGSTAAPPRHQFNLSDELDPTSRAIMRMIDDDSYVFAKDITKNPPFGFDNTLPRTYKTFISAAANDGVSADGMVTIDSPEPESLTAADATLVRLVGTIIALSESVRDGKPPIPEA